MKNYILEQTLCDIDYVTYSMNLFSTQSHMYVWFDFGQFGI